MQISKVTTVASLASSSARSVKENPTPGVSFKEIMAGGLEEELKNIQGQLANGHNFSPKELLLYQVKASQFGLRVELVSRVAESLVAVTKKLQTSS